MKDIRIPNPGEIQIVVLLGATTFIAWAPQTEVEGILDSFEKKAGLTVEQRTGQAAHAAIRIEIARHLRGPKAERMFTQTLAAGCLWLALRHWSGSQEMQDGLRKQMEQDDFAVVTASIPDHPPEGALHDSAWAFMIGSRIHDGRDQLAGQKVGIAKIIQTRTR